MILKRVDDQSNEVSILKYLHNLKGSEHHIIALLDVVQLHMCKMIALPQMLPLPHVLPYFYSSSSIVASIQRQFLHGVAFLHQHGVAHLDLKPDNIVIKYVGRHEAPTTFIIDFGSSVKVRSVGTTAESMRGTPGWVAPEVAVEKRFSPILVDRWACGKMLAYFGEYAKLTDEMEAFSHRLMDREPSN